MTTDEALLTKRAPKKYAVLCKDSKAQFSPLTNDVTTINNCELRLKLRPSVATPKPWSWSKEMKNVRPSTMSTHLRNYRYGASNVEKEGKFEVEKHRRFKSAPEISQIIQPKSSQTLPNRPRRYSVDVKETKNNKKQSSLMKPEVIVKEKESNLKINVNEFLAKKNPGRPPESLRIQRIPRFMETEAVIKNKYSNKEENEREKNVINPSTAPSLQMFAHHRWNYENNESWRYLRVKDPDPLSIDCIFKNDERKIKD